MKINNLSFAYAENGKEIFKDFNWELDNNNVHFIMGENGSGKTTFYEIISDNSFNNSKTLYSYKNTTLKITDKDTKNYIDYANKNGYDLWPAYRNNFNANDTEKFLNSNKARKNAVEFLIKEVIDTKSGGINI